MTSMRLLFLVASVLLLASIAGCNTELGIDDNTFVCDPSLAGTEGTDCLDGYMCMRVIGGQRSHCVPVGEADCDFYQCEVTMDDMDETDLDLSDLGDGDDCSEGQTLCGGRCVNLNTSPTHCGQCGAACQPGEECQSGVCRCAGAETCGDGEACCGGTCQPETAEDCVCGGGTCGVGFSCCDEACVALEVDENNCGGCGVLCPDGAECVAGECQCSNNELCPSDAPNTDAVACVEDTCQLNCAADFVNCDDDPANGCEAEPLNDPENCGGCGLTCGATANACVGGECDPITQIVSGASTTCVLRQSGNVACWGSSSASGQTSTNAVRVPTLLPDITGEGTLDNAVDVDVYDVIGCAVLSSEQIVCWGSNDFGTISNSATPDEPFTGWPSEVTPEQVAVGLDFVCVLGNDNEVLCAGNNDSEVLGDFSMNLPESQSWVQIDFSSFGDVTRIDAGAKHVCAVAGADDQLYCWGTNQESQLGDGTVTTRIDPVPVAGMSDVQHLAAGQRHTCVHVDRDGEMPKTFCWGFNGDGQLGRSGDTTVPGEVTELDTRTLLDLSVSRSHTCAVDLQEVWCWGLDNVDQSTAEVTDPEPDQVPPTSIDGFTSAKAVATGYFTSCVLNEDNTALCWGAGDNYRLGNNNDSNSATPVFVSDLP